MEAILLPNEEESLRWVMALLEDGEDPNQFDDIVDSFPILAAWQEAIWEEGKTDRVLKHLLNSGADINCIRDFPYCIEDLIVNGAPELTIFMLGKGMKFDWFYSESESGELLSGCSNPLYLLLKEGKLGSIEALIPHGILTFMRVFDDLGDAPLGCAARDGNIDAAEWLLNQKADVNLHCKARIGDTALDQALHANNYEMVKLLIDHGANSNIPTWMSITAFQRAERRLRDNKKSKTAKQIFKLVEDASRKHPKLS